MPEKVIAHMTVNVCKIRIRRFPFASGRGPTSREGPGEGKARWATREFRVTDERYVEAAGAILAPAALVARFTSSRFAEWAASIPWAREPQRSS